MHQNTQFHIEKQKSSTPWEGGHPPPPPPRLLRSLAGGMQEIWNAPCGISDNVTLFINLSGEGKGWGGGGGRGQDKSPLYTYMYSVPQKSKAKKKSSNDRNFNVSFLPFIYQLPTLWAWALWTQRATAVSVPPRPGAECSVPSASSTRSSLPASWPHSTTPTPTLSAASSPTTRRRYDPWPLTFRPLSKASPLCQKCTQTCLDLVVRKWSNPTFPGGLIEHGAVWVKTLHFVQNKSQTILFWFLEEVLLWKNICLGVQRHPKDQGDFEQRSSK